MPAKVNADDKPRFPRADVARQKLCGTLSANTFSDGPVSSNIRSQARSNICSKLVLIWLFKPSNSFPRTRPWNGRVHSSIYIYIYITLYTSIYKKAHITPYTHIYTHINNYTQIYINIQQNIHIYANIHGYKQIYKYLGITATN